MRPRLSVLEQPIIEKIVEEAFIVLEKSGVLIEDPHALERLAKAGFHADPSNNRVYMPRAMVEQAIKDAPSSITLHDRDGEFLCSVSRDRDGSPGPSDHKAIRRQPCDGGDNNSDRGFEWNLDDSNGSKLQHRADRVAQHARPVRCDKVSIAVCVDYLDTARDSDVGDDKNRLAFRVSSFGFRV